MSNEHDDLSMEESIEKVVSESDADLHDQAESYYNSLSEASELYGEKGVSSQAKYIASNIKPTDEESKELQRKLEKIAEGKNPEEESDETDEHVLTDREFGKISSGFESFTEEKVRNDKLVTVEDFERYAQRVNYNVDKVFCANPWVTSAVTEQVLERIKHANKIIEVEL